MSALGQVAPVARQREFSGLGVVLPGAKLYTYIAGTPSTPLATYNNADLAAGHENTNPVVADSGGLFGPIYLLLGRAYKFLLTDTDGNTIWSQDYVTDGSASAAVTGLAGEDLAADSVAYLSDGSGGKTPGSWYLADADFTYASSDAGEVGIVLAAIAGGSSGIIRTSGQMTVGLTLSVGGKYYVSTTAGAMTLTPTSNTRFVGIADGVHSIVIAANPAATSGYDYLQLQVFT